MKTKRANNRGYSLIELIVVIAIMALTVGALTVSVSLLTDSESKKACSKLEAFLDEVKTGAMSRSDETLTVRYMGKGSLDDDGNFTSSGVREAEGMYAVKRIWTLEAGDKKTESGVAGYIVTKMGKKEISSETSSLCNGRVNITLEYEGGSCTVNNSNGNYFTIKYDRATGLLANVDVYNGLELLEDVGKPISITCTTDGRRKYVINFNSQGKHTRSGN